MNSLAKLLSYFRPHPDRKRLSDEFRALRNKTAKVLQRPGAILMLFVWLGFAFDTDPKLHPEFPEMFYFRMGLTVCGLFVLIISFFEKLRGAGLGWLYFMVAYLFFATSFFTGVLADDANYVLGLQIIILLLILAPTTMRQVFLFYSVSILLFVAGIFWGQPVLNTPGALYSMQNLVISYIIGIVFGYVLDNARFDSFYKNLKLQENKDEIEERMRQVQALKKQQDGDYFLTSLLLQPLMYNGNKSPLISTEFFLRQKKNFEFGHRRGDIGGDICISGNLRMGKSMDDHRRFTVFMNADAMGKSLQGAGGALVAGVLMNSTMAQSARGDRVLQTTPQDWLTQVFDDFNRIFLSFDGSMLLSAIVGIVAEDTGELWYFNAEHPQPVLYRDDKASFLESPHYLYKLGAIPEPKFHVCYEKLYPNDVLLLASDGRDDLEFNNEAGEHYMNEDEKLFLRCVEKSQGDSARIFAQLKEMGTLTDDFSLLKVVIGEISGKLGFKDELKYLLAAKDFQGVALLFESQKKEVQDELSLQKTYGSVLLKLGNYEKGYAVLRPLALPACQDAEIFYNLAVACKRTMRRDEARQYVEMAIKLKPNEKRFLSFLSKLGL